MEKFIKLFGTHNQYESFTHSEDFVRPNVSVCQDQPKVVHYNHLIETKVVAKYNVTSTSSPTALRTNYEQDIFKSMEIDGVMLDELVTEYTFDTTGVHTVKYELYDDTSLGFHAPVFYNANLIEVIIPDSVTNVGNNAFNYCTGLVKVTMGKGVINIDNLAFLSCSSLTSIDIPNSVTRIGAQAFSSCSGLVKVTIGSGVLSIEDSAFSGCSSLASINIPNSVTSIGANAFGGCTSLTSVNIPSSVTTIGNYAFSGCNFTSINIPSSVTSIANSAFNNCNSLASITVDSGNGVYDSRNNCNAIIKTNTNELIVGCKNTTIPNNVTSIGDNAFYGCSGLTSIDIPNGVTSIGGSAFNSCNSLTSINIPSGVTSIGDWGFYGCASLTSIDIPNSVTTIGNAAFNGCSGLTSCTIGSGVTSIGSNAFYYCRNLARITCNATTAPTITNNTFYMVKSNGTLTVPSGSTGYNTWMGTGNYYLGKYGWTKVEQ